MDADLAKLRRVLPTINGQNTLLFFKRREQEIREENKIIENKKKPKVSNHIEEKIDNLLQKYDNIRDMLVLDENKEKDESILKKLELKRYIGQNSSTSSTMQQSESMKNIIHANGPSVMSVGSNFYIAKKKKFNSTMSPHNYNNDNNSTTTQNNTINNNNNDNLDETPRDKFKPKGVIIDKPYQITNEKLPNIRMTNNKRHPQNLNDSMIRIDSTTNNLDYGEAKSINQSQTPTLPKITPISELGKYRNNSDNFSNPVQKRSNFAFKGNDKANDPRKSNFNMPVSGNRYPRQLIDAPNFAQARYNSEGYLDSTNQRKGLPRSEERRN